MTQIGLTPKMGAQITVDHSLKGFPWLPLRVSNGQVGLKIGWTKRVKMNPSKHPHKKGKHQSFPTSKQKNWKKRSREEQNTYRSFTRDSTVPNHQVNWPILKCLRLSNKTLQPKIIPTTIENTKTKFTKIRNKPNKVLNKKKNRKQEKGHGNQTWGWFFLQALRSSARRPRAIPPDIVVFLQQLFKINH